MVAERDAESSRGQQHRRDREVEPINAEVPEIKRHRGQRKKKCADQEAARRPIDSIGWDSKDHRRVVENGRMPTNKVNEVFSIFVSLCLRNNIRIGFVKNRRESCLPLKEDGRESHPPWSSYGLCRSAHR